MKPSQILQRTRVTLAFLALGVTAADLAAREWTSADGKFKIEAELVEVKDGQAFLKRPDGSFVAVRLEKLSDRDRKFIESNAKSTARPANDSPSESEAVAPPGPIQIVKLAGEKPDDPPGEVRRFSDLGWDVTSLAFSPTGGLLAAGKLDQTLILFDVNASQRKATLVDLKLLDQITACAFTPEGGRLLAGGSSGLIGIWRLAGSDDLVEEPHFSGHVKKVTSIAVSSDGRFALSGGDDKLVRYWRIENGAELAMFEGFKGSLKACHISPDGGTGFATDGHALLTINLKSKKTTVRKLTDSWASGQFAAFSADARYVAAGDLYNVRLWEMKSGKELRTLLGDDIQWSGAFTPDGTRLVTGEDGKANVWDVKNQKLISSIAVRGTGNVQVLAVSPDNWHIAAIPGASGQTLRVFRIPKK